jgi:hypothetical protein
VPIPGLGAETHSRMMTLSHTATQQGIDAVDYLENLAGFPTLSPLPSSPKKPNDHRTIGVKSAVTTKGQPFASGGRTWCQPSTVAVINLAHSAGEVSVVSTTMS